MQNEEKPVNNTQVNLHVQMKNSENDHGKEVVAVKPVNLNIQCTALHAVKPVNLNIQCTALHAVKPVDLKTLCTAVHDHHESYRKGKNWIQ